MNLSIWVNGTTLPPIRREFATISAAVWIPCILVLGIASIGGTFGNILILAAVAKNKYLRGPESVFIVNLACSDLYVTLIADPVSIIAKVVGEEYFHHHPTSCRAIAGICTVTCTCSLLSIGGMSFSRYMYICHNSKHKIIFTKSRMIIACVIFYSIGAMFVLLNLAGFGSHGFDVKKMECIFQTSNNHTYTVVFFLTTVLLPVVVISVSFILMYRHVAESKRKICAATATESKFKNTASKLAKTLFIIFMAFTVCWTPFAFASIMDHGDNYHSSVHLFLTIWAHMHASINWLVYFQTNKKFNKAFKDIFRQLPCVGKLLKDSSSGETPAVTTHEENPHHP